MIKAIEDAGGKALAIQADAVDLEADCLRRPSPHLANWICL